MSPSTLVDLDAVLAGVDIVDLSVLVDERQPVWPGNPPMRAEDLCTFEAQGNYNRLLTLDEHAGTHWDAPAHFIAAPEERGLVTTETVPLERLVVPACVIDADAEDAGAIGVSPKLGAADIAEWEAEHGPIRRGDGVLLRTGWTDDRYLPLPEGADYAQRVVDGETAPWPGLDVSAMELLVRRGVALFGTDTPSAGPLDDVAAVHEVGLSRGIVFVENLVGLGRLPHRGALFVFLPLKLVNGSGAPGRAIALVPRSSLPTS